MYESMLHDIYKPLFFYVLSLNFSLLSVLKKTLPFRFMTIPYSLARQDY